MELKEQRSRIEFLKGPMATSVITGLSSYVKPTELPAALADGKIPRRPLGKTGYMVGIYSFGGQATIETIGKDKEAMDYVMTLPVSTIIIGLDNVDELEENIRIAREFKPLNADEMLIIEEKAKPYFKDLMFFKGLSKWPPEW